MTGTGEPDTSIARRQRILEIAIPVLAFGPTIAGIVFLVAGYSLNYAYFSVGGIFASLVLAYLAWIRPRKDIVALMTPVYSFIFLSFQMDMVPWVVLFIQLLFAGSLAILLVRLKRRFGPDATTLAVNDRSLDARVATYLARLEGSFPWITSEHARIVGEVFIRFARGNYREAAEMARDARVQLEGVEGAALLSRALEIAGEQAGHLDTDVDTPLTYLSFLPEHVGLLAIDEEPGLDREAHCQLTLDNALLLLFAAAWIGSEANRDQLRSFGDFAVRLIEA